MQQDAAEQLRRQYPIGTPVSGTIYARAPFGVFLDLAPGTQALLLIAYMDIDPKLYGVNDQYAVGTTVTASVLSVYDSGEIRLSQRGGSPAAA
jgi:predicted RNA-binding protein with RPS1 domain